MAGGVGCIFLCENFSFSGVAFMTPPYNDCNRPACFRNNFLGNGDFKNNEREKIFGGLISFCT